MASCPCGRRKTELLSSMQAAWPCTSQSPLLVIMLGRLISFPFGDCQNAFGLQAHYPERLSMLWMYEAPTIFWGLWQVSLAAICASTPWCMPQYVHVCCVSQSLMLSP